MGFLHGAILLQAALDVTDLNSSIFKPFFALAWKRLLLVAL